MLQVKNVRKSLGALDVLKEVGVQRIQDTGRKTVVKKMTLIRTMSFVRTVRNAMGHIHKVTYIVSLYA